MACRAQSKPKIHLGFLSVLALSFSDVPQHHKKAWIFNGSSLEPQQTFTEVLSHHGKNMIHKGGDYLGKTAGHFHSRTHFPSGFWR